MRWQRNKERRDAAAESRRESSATEALPSNDGMPGLRAIIPVLGVTQILAWGSSYYLLAVLAKPIAADTPS